MVEGAELHHSAAEAVEGALFTPLTLVLLLTAPLLSAMYGYKKLTEETQDAVSLHPRTSGMEGNGHLTCNIVGTE